MSRQNMEAALAQVPVTKGKSATQIRPLLLEVADQLQDEILGIFYASDAYQGFMGFVVTPGRLIGVSLGGTVQAWRYQDVPNIQYLAGKKKMFGGHEYSFLRIMMPDGNVLTYMVQGDHVHGERVGKLLETAHRKARIAHNVI